MEAAHGCDHRSSAGGEHGHLQSALDGFGATVGEERVLQAARRQLGENLRQVATQRIEKFL